ncbi:hypothetical protein [Tenacibaculum sp. E3R01]|nr:hypothetical protein [Tenacibaculum sp. E3R01]
MNTHISAKALTNSRQFQGIDEVIVLKKALYVYSSNYFKMK